MSASNGPIYITGLDRTGKTTMRAFLASHSRIAIPAVGSNMWMYFYRRFGDLGVASNLDACLDAMLTYKHVVFLDPDEAGIRAEFARGAKTYARLFAIFLEQFARREDKPRWGAQSGLEEQYADEMFAAYPGLKMIQMVRDPRDRYAASLQKWPDGRGRAGGAAARWAYTISHAERNLRRHAGGYLVVRFEDLVRDPQAELERVCAFLGEELEEDMLTMSGADTHRERLSGASGSEEILDASFIGIHQNVVPADETRFLELRLGPAMRRWGYETPVVDGAVHRPGWWLRVVPDQMIRMAAWRMTEEVNRRLPRWMGRSPGNRMIVERVGAS